MRKAAATGLDVIALTDHDTTRGHAEAVAALPEGLTLVTGAELSCRVGGVSMHMLATSSTPRSPPCSPSANWSGTTGCRGPRAWSPS